MPPASVAPSGRRPGSPVARLDAGRGDHALHAADLTLAKDARCQTAKRSGYKAAKARKAIDTPPQPLARVNAKSGPAHVDLTPGHVRGRVVRPSCFLRFI